MARSQCFQPEHRVLCAAEGGARRRSTPPRLPPLAKGGSAVWLRSSSITERQLRDAPNERSEDVSKLFSVMSLTVLSRRAFGALVVALLLPPCLSFADDEIAAELSLPVNRLFGGARLPDPAEEEA